MIRQSRRKSDKKIHLPWLASPHAAPSTGWEGTGGVSFLAHTTLPLLSNTMTTPAREDALYLFRCCRDGVLVGRWGGAMAVVRHYGLGLIVVVCCFSIMRALATRTQNIIDFIINKGTSNIFRCITKYIKNIFVLSWSAIEVCK